MSKTDVSPTSLQIAILRSKASGKDDAAAARELHISERTLRRHLDQLTRTLGVAGRLALGIEVGQRGWLSGERIGAQHHIARGCRALDDSP